MNLIDRHARLLEIGEVQGHTFHDNNCNDEVDWIVVKMDGNLIGGRVLTLSSFGGYNFPVSSSTISLFNAKELSNGFSEKGPLTGVNISQIGHEVKINFPCNINLTHDDYVLIKVERINSSIIGRYTASLDYSMPQPAFRSGSTGIACSGTIVSDIMNLPRNGYTLTYNTSPNISLVGNQAGDIVIGNVTSGQQYWVDAIITYGGCTVTIRKELTPSAPLAITPIQVQASPMSGIYSLSITPITGATSYQWTTSSGCTITSFGPNATVSVPSNATCSVTVTVIGPCGSTGTANTVITNFGESEPNIVIDKINPNPSDGQTRVILKKENEEEDVQVIVTSQYGEVVLSRTSNLENIDLNTANLPTGMYYIKVITPTGIDTKTLLIQH